MKRQYVYVEDENGDGIWCHGIYDDFYTALGHMMTDIWDFQKSYEHDGDIFEISPLYETEGDGGYLITVNYKSHNWTHMKEPRKAFYYILFNDMEDDGS